MLTLAELEATLRTLPRRYPVLLVDRIDACTPGVEARGVKCVTVNEPYFQGHFPGHPVMPGVLIMEALVQLATWLALESGEPAPQTVRSIGRARFKRQVIPGDLLVLEARMAGDGKFVLRASVSGVTAAEAEMILASGPAVGAAPRAAAP